jgi:hypothetical protein
MEGTMREGGCPTEKTIALMAALSLLLCGCATLGNKGSLAWEKALGSGIGIAATVVVPESSAALNGICVASGLRDRSLMVSALQKLWTAASDSQVGAVVEDINILVGATGIMDANATEPRLSHWQEVLGSICVGSQIGEGAAK